MQKPLSLGLLLILSATACAPVASSVPKLRQQPRTDSVIVDSAGSEDPQTIVTTEEKFVTLEKKLPSDYTTIEFTANDPEFADFRDTRSINKIELTEGRADVTVVVVLANGTKLKENAVKLETMTGKVSGKKKFTLSVSKEETTEANWNVVKKNLSKIVIGYRPAKL